MTRTLVSALTMLVAVSLALGAPAADPGHGLVIRGALPKTGTLTRAQLETLGAVDGHWARGGKDHSAACP